MATGAQITVREYLSTTYRPDCDYVDGVVEERNLGEYDHARLQARLIVYFYSRLKEWGLQAVPEQRVQVAPTRFRIPDICAVKGEPTEQIFRTPPFLCIEILSSDDRMSRMQERVQDFLKFGVPYVWIIDPRERKAFRCTLTGMYEVEELAAENPDIVIPLGELFE